MEMKYFLRSNSTDTLCGCELIFLCVSLCISVPLW
jgi:hypothetical protein